MDGLQSWNVADLLIDTLLLHKRVAKCPKRVGERLYTCEERLKAQLGAEIMS